MLKVEHRQTDGQINLSMTLILFFFWLGKQSKPVCNKTPLE